MKATVDKNLCIGCGLCTELCPNVFLMEDDGKAFGRNPVAAPDETMCRDAALQCPVEAITVS